MDEYVRQGERVAGAQSGAGGLLESASTGLPQLTDRMFQYASDFASVWMEAMGVMIRNGSAAGEPSAAQRSNAEVAPDAGPRDQRPRKGPPPSESGMPSGDGTGRPSGVTSVIVEVTSRQPVRAVLDLRSGVIDGPLEVPDLRARDPRRSRLKGVTIETAPDGRRLTIRLNLANRHPAGEYVGSVVDRSTAVTRGTLTVTVGAL